MFRIAIIFCLIAISPVSGQILTTDTSNRVAFIHAVSLYDNAITDESRLYNGREYGGYKFKLKGHPYFEKTDWQAGFIIYEDAEYENVPLLYDLIADEIIIRTNENPVKIQLVKEKVKYFSVWDHVFININADSTRKYPLNPGFYDVLAKGKATVLVKRVKTIYETISSQKELDREVLNKNKHYICKDNVCYPADTKGAALKVFKEHKKEIVKYLKKSRIKFRERRELALIKIAEYYNATEN